MTDEQNDAGEVETAPSGNEQTVISTDGNTSVAMPGADSPVDQQGNTLDFDQGEIGNANTIDDLNPDNATIEFDNAGPEGGQEGAGGEQGGGGDAGSGAEGGGGGDGGGGDAGGGGD